MNSPSSILPLVETHSVIFDNFSIYIEHIHDFEVVQLHNIVNYDKDFAVKLWDKIEDYIITKVQPVYQNGIDSEYNWRDERYSAVHSDIKERAPLGFFCRMDGCYFLDHQTIVDESNEDFSYWFSLKLRQYDLNLQTTSEFLKHHLKENFGYKKEKFIEFLEMCLLQYPEMFSDRLCLTVRTWMTKNLKSKNKNADLLNDAQTYNASNEPLLNDAQTYNHSNEQLLNVAQTSKRKENSKKKSKKEYPLFKWNDLKYKEKQIEYLYNQLKFNNIIDIEIKKFKNIFNGISTKGDRINWEKPQHVLIYLLNKLHPYLNSNLYNKDNTIIIGYIAPYFLYRGEEFEVDSWRVVKSKNKDVEHDLYKVIDQIISQLCNIS